LTDLDQILLVFNGKTRLELQTQRAMPLYEFCSCTWYSTRQTSKPVLLWC